jgi:diaminopimelate decarboxylase
LILEPGRSLVAQAGVALYRVGGRKVIPDVRTFVNIDGGLADNPRPALYRARYTALLANRAAEPETETVTIAGPFCESGDILIESVDLPPAAAGDILAVPVAGAYQLSMSSNYNAARRPAVLFIEEGQVRLVQRRETFDDLAAREL